MKIHKEEVEKKKISGLMNYESALSHIAIIFEKRNREVKFDLSCVCAFKCDIDNLLIKTCEITYDKIIVECDKESLIWPIQKYTCTVPLEEGIQLMENLRK